MINVKTIRSETKSKKLIRHNPYRPRMSPTSKGLQPGSLRVFYILKARVPGGEFDSSPNDRALPMFCLIRSEQESLLEKKRDLTKS
jgi:hypothetical protein